MPVRHPPHWQCPVSTHITPDKESALMDEDKDTAKIRIYTDRSELEGKIDTGAVLYSNGVHKGKLHYRLREISKHTVYEGELIGLCLGAELLNHRTQIKKSDLLF
jgi:hypothetical protein